MKYYYIEIGKLIYLKLANILDGINSEKSINNKFNLISFIIDKQLLYKIK